MTMDAMKLPAVRKRCLLRHTKRGVLLLFVRAVDRANRPNISIRHVQTMLLSLSTVSLHA